MKQETIDKINDLQEELDSANSILHKCTSTGVVTLRLQNGNGVLDIDIDNFKFRYSEKKKLPDLEARVARRALKFKSDIQRIIEQKIQDIKSEIDLL